MIKKKAMLLFAAVLMIWGLCSCTLADPGAGNRGADQLIGGLMTLESIDEGTQDEKIYAEIEQKNGEIKEIRFEGIDGWGLYFLQKNEGKEKVNYSLFDKGLSAGLIAAGDENSIEATLYCIAKDHISFYLNPVYRTSDGRIYMMPGSEGAGVARSEDFTGGATLTQSIYNKIDEHADGKTIGGTEMRVTAYLKGIYESKKVMVKQFDGQGNLLKDEAIDLNHPAETIDKARGMAYALVETYSQDGVQRKVYNKGEDIEFYTFDKKGICTCRSAKIQ